ncbi:hypothetical protein BVRB_1g016200 [Beta vulgaris subsp. vulgaris]|nr:hypothetical protein BVRB_1g016200 [Beta vulgaris subsp. vulgaris]
MQSLWGHALPLLVPILFTRLCSSHVQGLCCDFPLFPFAGVVSSLIVCLLSSVVFAAVAESFQRCCCTVADSGVATALVVRFRL